MKKFAIAALLSAACLNANAAIEIVGGKLFVADNGAVNVTFLGSDAGYTDLLFYVGTGSEQFMFNGHATTVDTTFSLGNFTKGTELTFRMHVNNTGDNFFTGPASANSDNVVHAHASLDANKSAVVGFEDLRGGGDRDYNDIQFRVTNVSAVPEADTWAMLAAGLGLLGLVRRKRKA
jgi:MYXO-CTERM domain-containing protein